MNTREQLQEAANHFLELLVERTAELTASVDEADRRADERASRYRDAAEEKEETERLLRALREERKTSPERVLRAELDGDYERENELRARHAEIAGEIEEAELRASELESEMRRIIPRPRLPHDADGSGVEAALNTAGGVGKASKASADEIRDLSERVRTALKEAEELTVARHERHRAWVTQMNLELPWYVRGQKTG